MAKDNEPQKVVRASGLANAPTRGPQLPGLAPVVAPGCALLVLGSFPGAASLARGQYYAHPQNQFWRILRALWPQHAQPGPDDYAARCQWLMDRQLGLWDVYAACERVGSLDASIRHGEVNDFTWLAQYCPGLRAIAHNGGESFRHARHTAVLGVPVHRLPSTSPAHAALGFDGKLKAWREVVASHGLLD
ncbi:DNA-deoxyinosine glycosylase [soil metagenome]